MNERQVVEPWLRSQELIKILVYSHLLFFVTSIESRVDFNRRVDLVKQWFKRSFK